MLGSSNAQGMKISVSACAARSARDLRKGCDQFGPRQERGLHVEAAGRQTNLPGRHAL